MFGSGAQWIATDLQHSGSYPLVQGVMAQNQALPAAATNGISVPGVLNQSNLTWEHNDPLFKLGPGGWEAWNILVPTTANHRISSESAGAGGTAGVFVDGTTMVASGESDSTVSGTAHLTAGLHTIMVRATFRLLS